MTDSGDARPLEPWFAPFALVNGAAVGLTPILLPLAAARYGLGHVGLVMGGFNLGAFAAPLVGALADRYHAYRVLGTACAAIAALSLWLFPLAGPAVEVLLALGDGAGFAGAMTIANLLVVERRPKAEWNRRLGWLETALTVGQGGARLGHRLASLGQVGEWGPASPSRAHDLHQRRRPLAGYPALLGGEFGWMLAAWTPAYAGSAVVFSL